MEENLETVNYFKDFVRKQNELKADFKRVSNDVLLFISRLENLNNEFRHLPERVDQENADVTAKFQAVIDNRKAKMTPVTSNLDDAQEIKKLNDIIVRQGWTIQGFIKAMDIASRTFYKKVETHSFSQKELNFIREHLALTDDEFMKLFFT